MKVVFPAPFGPARRTRVGIEENYHNLTYRPEPIETPVHSFFFFRRRHRDIRHCRQHVGIVDINLPLSFLPSNETEMFAEMSLIFLTLRWPEPRLASKE